MKRKVAGAGAVLAVSLVGIGGWYVAHTRATQSDLNRAIADYETRQQKVNVTFTVAPPPNTPKEQVLYLSGSVPALGNWDAAGVALTKSPDGKYTATVSDLLNGMEYAFKVTRGTWGTVETDKDGKEIANHTFVAHKDAKVEAAIANWVDNGQAVPGRVTMTGNIIVHKNALASKILNNQRTVVVYLPPGYDENKDQRYPVLYLQDGQNLFDEATSFQGIEWKLDETAQRLITEGRMRPAIIVGIYNAGEFRAAEFTPPIAGATGKGDAYARMLAEEAKPFIDEKYRTLTDRQNTIVGGGSQGALISLHAAKQHPNVFGQVVALSPWLRNADKPIIPDLLGDAAWLKNAKLYLDMGTDPGHNYPSGATNVLPDAQAFVTALEAAGLTQPANFSYREIEGGKHNEASWQATGESVLLALFGVSPPTTTEPAREVAGAQATPTTRPQ